MPTVLVSVHAAVASNIFHNYLLYLVSFIASSRGGSDFPHPMDSTHLLDHMYPTRALYCPLLCPIITTLSSVLLLLLYYCCYHLCTASTAITIRRTDSVSEIVVPHNNNPTPPSPDPHSYSRSTTSGNSSRWNRVVDVVNEKW